MGKSSAVMKSIAFKRTVANRQTVESWTQASIERYQEPNPSLNTTNVEQNQGRKRNMTISTNPSGDTPAKGKTHNPT